MWARSLIAKEKALELADRLVEDRNLQLRV